MVLVEELAARGWPAAQTVRLDGWLLRHTPSLTRRRSNSALPVGDAHGDPALVEEMTRATAAARSSRSPPPRRGRASTPSWPGGAGFERGPSTDVLVADATAVLSLHGAPGRSRSRRGRTRAGSRPGRRARSAPTPTSTRASCSSASSLRARTPSRARTWASAWRCANAAGRGCSASPPPRARAGAASRATWCTR